MISQLYKPFQKWSELGTIWIISDPHFNDPDVKVLRQNNISDDELISRINSKVGKYDTLIILGDIGDVSYISKLRGYKVLIKGNHDAGSTNYLASDIHIKDYTGDNIEEQIKADKKSGLITRVIYDLELEHRIKGYKWDNLFDEVYEGPLVISEKVILSHEPIDLPFMFNIHGHVHDANHKGDNNHLNVVCEAVNYEPINLNRLYKNGFASKVEPIHRITIDKATKNKLSKRNIK